MCIKGIQLLAKVPGVDLGKIIEFLVTSIIFKLKIAWSLQKNVSFNVIFWFFLLFLQKTLVNGFLTVSFNKVVNNFEREPKITLTNRTLSSFIRRKGYLKGGNG